MYIYINIFYCKTFSEEIVVKFVKFLEKLDNSVMNKVGGKEENVYKIAFDASSCSGTETERRGEGNKSF